MRGRYSIPAAATGTDLTIDIGGLVAVNLDTTRGTSDRLPLFFGGVLLVSADRTLAANRKPLLVAEVAQGLGDRPAAAAPRSRLPPG